MINISPVGLATAPVVNQLSLLATIREKLCRPFFVYSTIQPQAESTYTSGTPILEGTTLFIPISVVVTIVMPTCFCKTTTQMFTETFKVAMQGQTALPDSVTLSKVGELQGGVNIRNGRAYQYELNDSITIALG